MAVERVTVAGLIRDDSIQIRNNLNKDQVKHFREILDNLPPVLVVRAPEGDLLADGFHRAEAASKEGRADIEADIRDGSREDAVVLAIESNAKGHLPLKPKEREEAVLRLWHMRDSKGRKKQHWTVEQVAESTGTSPKHVSNITQADEARQRAEIHSTSTMNLPTKTWTEISHAPQEKQAEIAEAAVKGNGEKKPWTADQVRKVSQAAKSDPETYEAYIEGTTDVLTTASIMQDIKDTVQSDPIVRLDHFWVEVDRLRQYSVADLARAVTIEDRDNFIRWAEEGAEFLTDFATSLKRGALEAVR